LPASFTAQEANDLIRFFRGEPMKSWGIQFDEFSKKNQDYIIFQSMSATCTFPFPPILIDPQLLTGAGWRECGRPLHLIEGTHRVSYLRSVWWTQKAVTNLSCSSPGTATGGLSNFPWDRQVMAGTLKRRSD
jgi:hypothetical protein